MEEKKNYLIAIILILAVMVISLILRISGDENKVIYGIQYVEIAIEDTDAGELAHTEPAKITDEDIIANLEKLVNRGTEYEPRSTAWPDISPLITFYLENGECYNVFAVDNMSEEEEEGNYITIFKMNSDGEEDVEYNKKTYKIEAELEKYATQLYNQFK